MRFIPAFAVAILFTILPLAAPASETIPMASDNNTTASASFEALDTGSDFAPSASAAEKLQAAVGHDQLTPEETSRRLQEIGAELTTRQGMLGSAGHFQDVAMYDSVITLVTDAEQVEDRSWQALTTFLQGNDKQLQWLQFEAESFDDALDYLTAMTKIYHRHETDPARKMTWDDFQQRIDRVRRGKASPAILKESVGGPFNPVTELQRILGDRVKDKITSELRGYLQMVLGEKLLTEIFIAPDDGSLDQWYLIRDEILALLQERNELLQIITDQAIEEGNYRTDDGLDQPPFAEFPGECIKEAKFTFSVELTCWCAGEEQWQSELHAITPMAGAAGDRWLDTRRHFIFDDIRPNSTCRPCASTLHYRVEDTCESGASQSGSFFWGAVR